jgi:hypothetical protein
MSNSKKSVKKISITEALSCSSPFKVRNCRNCGGRGYVSSGGPDISCCYFCQGTGCLDPKSSYAIKNL